MYGSPESRVCPSCHWRAKRKAFSRGARSSFGRYSRILASRSRYKRSTGSGGGGGPVGKSEGIADSEGTLIHCRVAPAILSSAGRPQRSVPNGYRRELKIFARFGSGQVLRVRL